MGRKNRKTLPNPTPSASLRRPDAAAVDDSAAVRAEWAKASDCIQRNNHAKAVRPMKDAVDRRGGIDSSPPLLLRAYGTAHSVAGKVTSDARIRVRHLNAALQAAARAVEAAPDSAELALFHAILLLGVSIETENSAEAMDAYGRVVAESERGLQIKAPSDPALYSLDMDAPHVSEVTLDLRALHKMASEAIRRKEIQEKVARLKLDYSASAPSSAADHRIVSQDSAKTDASEQCQTVIDCDVFDSKLSTSDAHSDKEEEELCHAVQLQPEATLEIK